MWDFAEIPINIGTRDFASQMPHETDEFFRIDELCNEIQALSNISHPSRMGTDPPVELQVWIGRVYEVPADCRAGLAAVCGVHSGSTILPTL